MLHNKNSGIWQRKNKFASPGDDPAVTFLSPSQLKGTNKQPFQKVA